MPSEKRAAEKHLDALWDALTEARTYHLQPMRIRVVGKQEKVVKIERYSESSTPSGKVDLTISRQTWEEITDGYAFAAQESRIFGLPVVR